MLAGVLNKKDTDGERRSLHTRRNRARRQTPPNCIRQKGKSRTSVMLFAGEPIAAAGLAAALSGESGLQLVYTCSSTADLFDALARRRPRILLFDAVPEFTLSMLWQIRTAAPDCRTILWVRTVSAELAHQAIEHGVRGILSKKEPVETLIACITAIAQGAMWMEESLNASLEDLRSVHLSNREGQFVGLLSSGMSNKEIAERLRLSEGTVRVYLSRMFRKVGVNDRFELAICGVRNLAGTRTKYEPGSREELNRLTPWLRSIVIRKPSFGLSAESAQPRDGMLAAARGAGQ